MYGPVPVKGYWSPRWNSVIYNLYKYLNIVDNIQIRRLGWAGHIIRMEDERSPPKKRFLMGYSIIQDQWENQEGWMLFGGTHHRS